MKTFIIILLLSLLCFLSIIGIAYIITSVYAFIFYNRYKNAIFKSFYNTIHCGENECNMDINYLSNVPIFKKDYNKDMAKYCINLIQIIYDNYNNYDLKSPEGIKKEISLSYDDKNNIFAVLWSTSDTLFIIFRGTLNLEDWVNDATYQQNAYIESKQTTNSQISVNYRVARKNTNGQTGLSYIELPASIHKGFYTIYNKIKTTLIDKLAELDPNKTKNIVIAGHSLGSAVATICAADLYALGYKNCVTYVFASPRVGNEKFSDIIKNVKLYSIMNNLDVVPTMPTAVSPNFGDENQPNTFNESGTIFRFSENWKSIYNNHSLKIHNTFLPETM